MSPRERFRLRPLVEADLDLVLEWRNKPRIREMMYTDHVISREEHRGWYETIKDAPSSVYLILEHLGRPLGLTNFTGIDRAARSCLWGFYLGEDDRPRDAGTMLGLLSLNYAFETLALREVCGEVIEFNERSRALFERLGFTPAHRLPKRIRRKGVDRDVLVFTLTADDWRTHHRARVEETLPAG